MGEMHPGIPEETPPSEVVQLKNFEAPAFLASYDRKVPL